MNYRQATPPLCVENWVPKKNRLGCELAARRRMCANQIFQVFCEGSGDDEHPLGDASQFWLDFDFLYVMG